MLYKNFPQKNGYPNISVILCIEKKGYVIMKTDKKNSYEKVEASIKLHLLCIQMLFILGLVIEGQTCPDWEEFKTSIFLIITGIVISTIIFNIVLNKWFLYYLRQQLELPAPARNDVMNRYIVKGYLDFSFIISFWVVASIFCYNAGCFVSDPVITVLIILSLTIVVYFASKGGAIEEDTLSLLTMN